MSLQRQKRSQPLLGLGIGRLGVLKRIRRDHPKIYQRIMQWLAQRTHTVEEVCKEVKKTTGYQVSPVTIYKWRKIAEKETYEWSSR